MSRLATPWRASSSRTKWISVEVRFAADGVDAHQRARQLEGARGGSGGPCPSVQYSGCATSAPRDGHRHRPRRHRSAPRARIAGDIRRTPLLRIDGGQLGIDCAELWLKLEHLQIGGSFKARGMFNRMRSNAIPAAGVVIASGGNAGIAVACAAQALGVRCEVFVPETSSRAKRDKLAALGAIVNVVGASYADALAASLARQAESGALLMHAYDQREVVVGAARSPPRSRPTPACPIARSSASAAAA